MPRSRILLGSALAGGVLFGLPVRAQEADAEPAPVSVGAPGTYQGVCPGTQHPPAVAPAASTSTNVITWPGFQMLPGGGSRIFVQSTGHVATQLEHGKHRIEIHLGNAKLAHANNGRPLVTRFFNTPVDQAFVEVKRGKATLVLILRADAEPSVRSEAQTGTSYHFLYVDFPAGQYLPGAQPVAHAPAVPAASAPASAAPPPAPTHLEGDVSGNASAQGQVKAGSGKAEAKASGKAGGKVSIGF